MSTAKDTIHGYAIDLHAAFNHVAEALERHLADDAISKVPGAAAAVKSASLTVTGLHITLGHRIEALGGLGATGHLKEAVTSVSGFLAGLYGQIRGETASRMVRDDIVALHFLDTASTMLHVTAKALGDAATADLCVGAMQDLPIAIKRLNEVLPHVVVADLLKDHPSIDTSAAAHTIQQSKEAWREASTVPVPSMA